MNSLWGSLFSTLAKRVTRAFGGKPPAAAARASTDTASAARALSTVPPGAFDLRPALKCDTPHGIFCLPADFATDSAATAIAAGTPLPDALLKIAQKHIAPGSIVLDIGAGFGRTSLLFSALTGPAGRVLAFEADDYLCDVLQQTVAFNQCENIRVFSGAVYDGSRAGVGFPATPVMANAAYSGQRIDFAADYAGTLPTRTIDDLQIQAPVSLLYADSNGCEIQVLRGAIETIARFRMPIALNFNPALTAKFGSTPADLTAFFNEIGYTTAERYGDQLCLALPLENAHDTVRPRDASHAPDFAHPDIRATAPASLSTLCKLLQNRAEVEACTAYLKSAGYVPHSLACKNWDLAHLIPAIGDGNFLDMGSSDSYILKNLALKRIRGELYGIDLRAPDVPISAVRYLIGDLMHTPLPDGYFSNITCLSVLEHQVDYDKFAAEAARLLAPGGMLFVTFDYREPRVSLRLKLYGLDWLPLDAAMVRDFNDSCLRHGLAPVEAFDFTTGDPVIQWGYYSPHPEVSYTFGMAAFRKH